MAAPVARTRSRSVVATAVAALVLFVLSGCVKFNADFHVDVEETLTGTMQILVDPIALEDMGSNPSSELDDAVSDAQADPELPDGVTVDRVEDEDGYIGMGVTFDRVPAAELQNGGSGLDDVGVEGIEVVHTDGEISFTMANPLTAGMGSSDPFGSSGMPSSARSIFDEALVSITFPGNVIAADGAETNGKTATWNLREYDGDTLTATGDASSFPWGIVFIVAGGLIFLLIVAGVIILVLVLRKKNSSHSNHFHQSVSPPVPGGFTGPGVASQQHSGGSAGGYAQPTHPGSPIRQSPGPGPTFFGQPPSQLPVSGGPASPPPPYDQPLASSGHMRGHASNPMNHGPRSTPANGTSGTPQSTQSRPRFAPPQQGGYFDNRDQGTAKE